MRKALVRKGFAFAVLTAFVLAIGVGATWAGPYTSSADKAKVKAIDQRLAAEKNAIGQRYDQVARQLDLERRMNAQALALTPGKKDKMPVGPAKLFVAPVHGFVRSFNVAWKGFWSGLKKVGPLAPVYAAGLLVVDGVENVPRTALNTVTPFNDVNYNYDVGTMSPPAQAMADFVPSTF